MFTQLLAAMAIFEKITASKGFIKMPFLTASMIAMAIAIDVLAIAVGKLSKLDWEGLAKGLTGTAVLLGSLALFTKFGATNAGGIAQGAGLILLATGINILVNAVKNLSGLSWGEMAKGLSGVAALLLALGLFTTLASANAGGIAQGAGLILLATGIKILASAVEDIGKLSWTEIGKGLATVAGGLTLMAAALVLIPPTSIISAAAIFIVAKSLGDIGDALKNMGGMSWGEIAKGLVTLAGALTIITVAMIFMTEALPGAAALIVVAAALRVMAPALQAFGELSWGEIAKAMTVLAASLLIITAAMIGMTTALPGAAALLVVSAGLRVLTPVLQALGAMSWGSILKGLAGLAGVFLVLGVAGLVLTPLVPTILALGVAITLMGIGMAAAGAGMMLFGVGLGLVAASGAAAVGVLIGAVRSILNFLPEIVTSLGNLITAFAKAIQKAGPAVITAITVVLLSLLTAIDRLAPRIVQTLGRMLELMLAAMIKYIPKMADAGLKILIGILTAIANNIGKVIKAGADIVVNFLNGLQQQVPRVLQAGADLIIGFVNSLADTIRNNSGAMREAGGNLALAIIDGITGGLGSGVGRVVGKAKELASSALNAAKGVLGINSPSKEFMEVGKFSSEGLGIGFVKYKKFATKAAERVGSESIETLRSSMSGISDILTTDANFTPIIRPVLDLTDVQKNAGQIGSMLSAAPIKLETTAAKARDASVGYSSNRDAQQEAAATSSTNFEYTQINNSPKALSSAEIYRNTKSQLTTVKGALENAK